MEMWVMWPVIKHQQFMISIDLLLSNFPGGSGSKASCLQCGRPGFDPLVRKIFWRRKWQPTPVPLPGKSHGRRSVVGYSPWHHKESDTTERLHFTSLHCSVKMEILMDMTDLSKELCVNTFLHVESLSTLRIPEYKRSLCGNLSISL